MNSETAIDICVVIPAYNAEKFICDALDSVAIQDRLPDEIIIVDDGSTDSTREVIKKWQEDNNLVLRVLSQENAGPSAARNAAIKMTHREWIALLDADDVWCSNHLVSLESAVNNFSDSVAVFGDGYIFSGDTVITEWFSKEKAIAFGVPELEGRYYKISSELYKSLVPGTYILPSCLMFSRDAAVSIHYFDESLCVIEDPDFLLRLSKSGSFVYTKKLTVGCRAHDENITHEKNTLRNNYFFFRVLRKALNNSLQLALDPSEKAITERELSVVARSLVYSASTKGLGTYMKALRFLFRNKMYKAMLNPKNILRALFFSVNVTARNE